MDTSKILLQKIGIGTLTTIVTILTLLNIFSGIVGGIWLLLSGGIGLIIGGLIISFVMPWGYSLLAIPSLLLFSLVEKTLNKHKTITYIILFITSSYDKILLMLWVIYVFGYFISQWQHFPLIALILWGYSTMMGPLGYMAHKEGEDSTGTTFALLFSQVFYFVVLFLWFFNIPNRLEIYSIILLVYGIFTIYLMKLAIPKVENEDYILQNDESNKICEKCKKEVVFESAYCKFCGYKF